MLVLRETFLAALSVAVSYPLPPDPPQDHKNPAALSCPSFCLQIDTQVLDYGIVSVGFRYTLDFEVHNTCAIPMRFEWSIPQDTGEQKEFVVGLEHCSKQHSAWHTWHCTVLCSWH